MLRIKRGPGQSVMIADDVKVTVIAISGRTATLGVKAPKNVPVCREEQYAKKDKTDK